MRVLGMVTSSQVKTTKKGEKMAVMELLDGMRRLSVIVFPSTVRQKGAENLPDKGELAVVEGSIKEEFGEVRMLTNHLWSITDPLDQPHGHNTAPERTADRGEQTTMTAKSRPSPRHHTTAALKSSEDEQAASSKRTRRV